jgi:hypothetical protein
MRLSEDKIKATLVHPESSVRVAALSYFADCYSPDPDVMPLAIQAIQTFGWEGAFPLGVYRLAQLKQTEPTVAWAVAELNAPPQPAVSSDRVAITLSDVLCAADPALLRPREQEILQARRIPKDMIPVFQKWLGLASWDADRCWHELESICQQGRSTYDIGDFPFEHGEWVAGRLAQVGDKYTDRILELLGQKIDTYDDNPMVWMEIFLVILAGEMRLPAAVPMLVEKLHIEGEIVWEECVTALAKIGTPEAAELLARDWVNEIWDYRLFASGTMENIHTDATVRVCLDLLPGEKDAGIRTNLARGLLGNYTFEGIEPVRDLIRKRQYDSQVMDLPRKLVAISTALEVTFPEFEFWKQEAERKHAQMLKKMKEMEKFMYTPLPAPPGPRLQEERPREKEWPENRPVPFMRLDKKVGRNDPCPCGSKKKFKNCCMNKQG